MAFQPDCVIVWKVGVAGSHGIGNRAVEKIAIAVFVLAIIKVPRCGSCVNGHRVHPKSLSEVEINLRWSPAQGRVNKATLLCTATDEMARTPIIREDAPLHGKVDCKSKHVAILLILKEISRIHRNDSNDSENVMHRE